MPSPKPRTVTVIGLLGLIALLFSWIAAYAVTNALVAAELLSAWAPDADPRPRRMLLIFSGLMVSFLLVAGWVRHLSHRHLESIDAMVDPDEAAPPLRHGI